MRSAVSSTIDLLKAMESFDRYEALSALEEYTNYGKSLSAVINKSLIMVYRGV
jgi:hypothetical protein